MTRTPASEELVRWRESGLAAGLLVLLLVIVGAAVPAAYFSSRSAQYTSTVTIILNPSLSSPTLIAGNDSNSDADSTRFIATQSSIIQGDDVIRPSATSLGLSSLSLRGDISVESSTTSNILLISARRATSAQAQKTAMEVSSTYVLVINASIETQVTKAQRNTRSSIAGLQAEIATSTQPSERQALGAELTALAEEEAQLTASANTNSVAAAILTSANLPAHQSSPTAETTAVEGGVTGLVVGLLFCLVFRQRRRLLLDDVDGPAA